MNPPFTCARMKQWFIQRWQGITLQLYSKRFVTPNSRQKLWRMSWLVRIFGKIKWANSTVWQWIKSFLFAEFNPCLSSIFLGYGYSTWKPKETYPTLGFFKSLLQPCTGQYMFSPSASSYLRAAKIVVSLLSHTENSWKFLQGCIRTNEDKRQKYAATIWL
jgi:hypothetical protein